MQRLSPLAPALTMLWAGVSLGGNIIAAPAKFQVHSLATEELLLVGRAQFSWLGTTELCIAGVLGLVLVATRLTPSSMLIIATVLLFVQQFVWQPALQARSDLLQAGAALPNSHLHLIFVVAEIAKFALLASAGLVLFSRREA